MVSIVLFKDNKIIGISRIFKDPDNPLTLYQGQIGIYKGFKFRGLGKYLMGITYDSLLKDYREVEYMIVDTHPKNKPMISLPEGVGYQYTHTQNIYEN